MLIRIIAVGRLKEQYWRAAAQEYQKRLGPYARIDIVEIAEEKLADNPAPAEIEQGLKKEAERITKLLQPGAVIIPLAIAGKNLSSEELAARIERWQLEGKSQLELIIGGSHGLASEVLERATFTLSFSAMTFPHQMMRVILLEQLYRAFSIIGGGKYHK
ncbi:MAG: 23S rRNA (pseudouridine(1915)-N(3))-methyltransferase RlmH [Desulfocucumaceae bacterium]